MYSKAHLFQNKNKREKERESKNKIKNQHANITSFKLNKDSFVIYPLSPRSRFYSYLATYTQKFISSNTNRNIIF
jgi:hypothetical protein